MNLVCFYVFFIAILGMTGALLESDVVFLGNDRGVFSKFLCVLMRKGEVFFCINSVYIRYKYGFTAYKNAFSFLDEKN